MKKPETKTLKKKVDSPKEKAVPTKDLKAKIMAIKSDTKPAEKVKETNKAAITQRVVTHRELKYKYPKGVTDTLKRKAFRQQTRNKLRKFQRDMAKLEGKELTALQGKFDAFQKEVLQ